VVISCRLELINSFEGSCGGHETNHHDDIISESLDVIQSRVYDGFDLI
jgi:hypothetical protein